MLGSSFTEFKLGYSATKNMPIGKTILDDNEMFAGGRTWMIGCGVSMDAINGDYYLTLFAATPPSNSRHIGMNRIIFHTILMGRDGTPSFTHAKSSSMVTIGSGYTWLLCRKFMKLSELESGPYVNDDGFVAFVCGIIDLNSSDRIHVPPSDLGNHLGHLLHSPTDGDGSGSGSGSDVSFSVGGETFRAHRAILAARSPVFKAQLLGAMADAKMDSITLHDVEPAAFKILLRFMYTDELPSDDDTELVVKDDLEGSSSATVTELLQHLLAAADMYQMDRLKLMCAQKLWDRVSPENVAAMLVCAEMHSCPELKKRCIDFFVVDKNLKIAMLTEGYLRLLQGFPSVIEEIRARLVLDP